LFIANVLRRLEGAQATQAIVDCSLGDVRSVGQPLERMRAPGMQVQFGRYARIREAPRVGDVLVAEDVEVADVDIGGRKAGEVIRPRRR
jgi:hypothetical protein